MSEYIPWLIAAAGWALALLLTGMLLMSRRTMKRHLFGNFPGTGAETELLQGISRQLNSLDRIGERIEGLDRAFRIPRMRGGFGETLLEELLRSWLPDGSWTAQYAFPDGTRVDAVVRMGSRMVPVDSKFPLERLETWLASEEEGMPGDVKRGFLSHAEDIAAKYVRPDDGTLSFALMYLPAENIHYRLLRDDDGSVMKECIRRHVLPVGPMSLFAYLQTIAYGLKGMALPAEGNELRRRLDRLRRDFTALARPLATASTHLKNLNGSWVEIDRRLGRMSDSLEAMDTSADGNRS